MPETLPVLEELTRFGRALTGALRRETVAQCTLECLNRLFTPAAACVAVMDDTTRRPHVVAASGDPTLQAPDPFLDELARARGVTRHTVDPFLGAPLVAAGHTLGVLALRSKTPEALDASTEAALAAVAAQAAIALQNTRLIEILGAGKHEWEQMVDAIRPAICVLDERGTVRRANKAFAELVGTPVTALTGRPWLMLLPPAWADAVGRALDNPGGEGGEIRTDRRIYAVRAHAVAGSGQAVLLIEDVTETKRLQEGLLQSEKLSAIGQLIAGVAHELNNPLASVLGFADFLAESDQTPAPLAEPVRVIQQEAQRAAGIVRNLLTFARKQDQDRRRIEVGPVIQRTLQLLNNQLIGMKVEPKLVIEPNLPAIEASPNQIQQVFVNLVNNAAQAIATTGRVGVVNVVVRPWHDGVAVDVTDDGPGIPADVQERVFEPFFTTKREGEGTGLGLSICQGIIREHGGRITLRSAPGEGSTFTVELPGAGVVEAAAGPVAAQPHKGARVLVVDDEPHILYYMRATLEAWGHRVETATDGADALARALNEGFDLIITDVRMPRLGGREFYERLRGEQPEVARRIVFATGDTVRDDTMAFIERTGRPFLHKPFKLAELRSTLASALESVR